MIREVVNYSSVQKDTVELFKTYGHAYISEYWLVDARKTLLQFEIWKHTPNGYVVIRKRNGWIRSTYSANRFDYWKGAIAMNG